VTTVFVALGDSFTEGMADELGPAGRHRGWADRVAAALAVRSGGLRYANLAVRGRLLDQVVTEQIPVAESLHPDLVSFHAGPNDVLRPRVALVSVLFRYRSGVERLRADGRDVLLFTVIERAGGTGRTAARLASRFAAFNAAVRDVADRTGALLVDVGGVDALQDRRLWHEDRLHLAPEGHARVAAAVHRRGDRRGGGRRARLGCGPVLWAVHAGPAGARRGAARAVPAPGRRRRPAHAFRRAGGRAAAGQPRGPAGRLPRPPPLLTLRPPGTSRLDR
jgi:lysophospholipase L1-like esterase